MGRDPVTPAKIHGALTLCQPSPMILSPFHTSSRQGQSCCWFYRREAEVWLRKAGLLCRGHLAHWGQSWIPNQGGLTSPTLHAVLPRLRVMLWRGTDIRILHHQVMRSLSGTLPVCHDGRHSRGKREQGQRSRAGRKFGKSREPPEVSFLIK